MDDYLTIGMDDLRTGPINVNTASVEVLACIPDLSEENARKLVDYRKANPDKLGSIAWIGNVLDAQIATEIGPYVTTNVSRYCVDVVAVGVHGRGFKRMVSLVDVSGEKPVVVYRRDLSASGWCLGEDIREESIIENEGRSL